MNGYQQYKEQSIMTMTQGEMLLLLYDELTKRLVRADLALQKGDYALFDTSVTRCVDIVQYLRDTLDFHYEISRNLDSLYEFFLFELRRLKIGRRRELIDELKPYVKDLRDAFAEAEKKV